VTNLPAAAATAPGKSGAGSANPATVELSVLMPCLDEAETLATCIRKARGSLQRLGVDGEVVVADNGSVDGSVDIARREGARVVSVGERGYGAALRAGIETARGRYVIMADADDSYALDELAPFLSALRAGADLVVGNRFQGGIAPGAMPGLHRWLGNPVLSTLGRLFYGIPIGDFHCGMRGFRREQIMGLGLRTRGMEFASEMVVRAAVHNLVVTEVPTTLRPDGRSRSPHLRSWRDGWRHLRFLLTLSPRWLLLYPALTLLVTGFAAFGWLLLGSQRVGGVTFDIHTLIAAATAVVLGVQLGGLAILSRAYCSALGLLPGSSHLDRGLRRWTAERGLVAGLCLSLAGLGCFLLAVLRWRASDFGPLEIGATLRFCVAGMLLTVVGMQAIVVSLTLTLVVRRD